MTPTLKAGLRQHFHLYLMQAYRSLHPAAPPLELAWYLEAMCHALIEAASIPGSRLVITVPPRHLKSIAAAVALPTYLLGREPTLRIIVATYSQNLARLHARQAREIMQSDWYRALFPRTRIADDSNRVIEFTTTALGGRQSVSVGGTVTGFGADVLIVDDCLKADEARSEARRAEVKAWFDGTLATRLNNPGGGTVISISQRFHEDDLAVHLIDKGYRQLCLPAIGVRDERIPIGLGRVHHRRVGDLLGRSGITRAMLEAERISLGAQVFEAQYQQNPVAPQGNLIRSEWFGSYEGIIARERFYRVIQSWDTGLSDEPTADYSVCTTWGYLNRHWHLLDVLRARLAFPDLKRAVLRHHRIWRPDKVVIEHAGTGIALWQELRFSPELRPVMWPVQASKEERVIGITGLLEAGLCLLPVEAPWLDAFRNELRAFPFGRHDDQVDSMSQFLAYHLSRGRSLLAERDPVSGRKLQVTRRPLRARR